MADAKVMTDKKQEFLAAALELFYEKGYDKTTIQDIINKLGVSKGAFYHYFESKEAVIEAISTDFALRVAGVVRPVIEREDLQALEKFNLTIDTVQQMKKRQREQRKKIKRALMGDENLLLQKKIITKISELFKPFYRQLIQEGIDQGVYRKTDAKQMAEYLLSMIHSMNTDLDMVLFSFTDGQISEKEYQAITREKLAFYEDVFGRTLGMTEGRLELTEAFFKDTEQEADKKDKKKKDNKKKKKK